MIAELRVRDLATIAEVTLPLGPGLNVLTGETGAGKSMLVDAIGLLLGERADSGAIRPGAGKAVVEGAFEVVAPAIRRRVEEQGLDLEDDRLIVRREVSAEGRSRAWVNGSPTTVSVLEQLGGLLVDLHGQHETQSLLHAPAQRDILDAFAGAEPERAAVAEAFHAVAELTAQIDRLTTRRDEARRRADYLRHVVAEIDRARLEAGETEALALEARRLSHAEALIEQARRIQAAIEHEDAGARQSLAEADRALSQLERTDPAVAPWRELLDAAYANLSELGEAAARYAEGISQDPERLAAVEARRDLIGRLLQKYGPTVEAVLAARTAAAAELELLDTAELDLRTLAARQAAARSALETSARALTEKRGEAAGRLARSVNLLFPKLGLPGGKFEVALSPLSSPGSTGRETPAFQIRLNAGMDFRPLSRAVSGGELSRIMLALKVTLARQDAVPVLIFDEVDQGIGGEVATRIGEALAKVAQGRQVLVVTHLPQIAARADRHLVVSKSTRAGAAVTEAQVVHGEDRIIEVARMLGDADGKTARTHAEALLRGVERETVR
jgi:DNA repair protein RecN (Recombination protein N)